MTGQVSILNIKIDKVNMEEAKNKVKKVLKKEQDSSFMIVTPNPEIVMRAQTDMELARILNKADLAVPDGGGIVLASKILKNPVPERVPGFDLMQELFSCATSNNYKIYLLGGKPGILKEVKANLRKKYSGINICGTHHGYLDKEEQKKVISEINSKKPHLLFVGMGVPLQEKFLDKFLEELEIKVAMTVGGSFDVLSGQVNRAPKWMQQIYLEWFYRLITDPSRIGRMLSLPKFVFLILFQALKQAGGKNE